MSEQIIDKALYYLGTTLEQKLIANVSYTSGTANTWTKSVNITIPKSGLYRIRASYSNSAVSGIAYGQTSNTNVNAIIVLAENTHGASIDNVFYIPSGTWAFWTKCVTASKANSIVVWSVLTTP